MSVTNIYVGHEPDSPDPIGTRISKQAPARKKQRRKFQKRTKTIPHTIELEENSRQPPKVEPKTITTPNGVATRFQHQNYHHQED